MQLGHGAKIWIPELLLSPCITAEQAATESVNEKKPISFIWKLSEEKNVGYCSYLTYKTPSRYKSLEIYYSFSNSYVSVQ